MYLSSIGSQITCPPLKPGEVVTLVHRKTGKAFSLHNHTQAWRKFEVRPRQGAAQPENTKRDYCVYHAAHKDYTYSEQWVAFLIAEVNDAPKFVELKAFQI